MVDLKDKYDLYNELDEIRDELVRLRARADRAVAHLPTPLQARANAYAVTKFGCSDNPYDTTFETIFNDFDRSVFSTEAK